jgi:hypothetical protein
MDTARLGSQELKCVIIHPRSFASGVFCLGEKTVNLTVYRHSYKRKEKCNAGK